MPRSFGAKLATAFEERGQLCVGIDPHAELLHEWGLNDDVRGLDFFAKSVLSAAYGRVGIIKPQVSFFERFGSAGYAVLEDILRLSAEAGLLVIADAKRGDIGSTMDAYLEAWLGKGSSLQTDSVTVSPFLGLGTISQNLGDFLEEGKSVFALVATSNPEGESIQLAKRNQETISKNLWSEIEKLNNITASAGDRFGGIGVVIGATLNLERFQLDLAQSTKVKTPILAPGFGAQGANLSRIKTIFGSAANQVLASVSRSVSIAGPVGISKAIDKANQDLLEGLQG